MPADLRLVRVAQPADRGGGADRRVGAGREGHRPGGGRRAARRPRARWPSPARSSPPASGTGVVVATGAATEIGRISTLLAEVEPLTTPLLRQMDRLRAHSSPSSILALAALDLRLRRAASAATPSADDVHGRGRPRRRGDPRGPAGGDDHHAGDRRAAHGAAQRDHPPPAGGRDAGLGHRDLLRQDRHADPQRDDRADASSPRDGTFEVTRRGLRAGRRVQLDGRRASTPASDPLLGEIALAALLCNDAQLRRPRRGWRVDGDPTEGALRLARASRPGSIRGARARGLPAHATRSRSTSEHRFMATLHHDRGGRRLDLRQGRAGARARHVRRAAHRAAATQPLDAGATGSGGSRRSPRAASACWRSRPRQPRPTSGQLALRRRRRRA